MFFYDIPNDEAASRTALRLLELQAEMTRQGIPPRNLETLLLATWNIREFDSPAYGDRVPEAMLYIAEIISHFDLVAIQEVRADLRALDKLRALLGDWWRYIATDVTKGTAGNHERMAFLYDTRKVKFGGVAGEVVVPPVKRKLPGERKKKYDPARQLYRTPYLCAFQAGWARFMLSTVHIVYGKNVADSPLRTEEIRLVAEFLADHAAGSAAWSKNMILLGDFNIFKPGDVTMTAITDAGFRVPAALQGLPPTNTGKQKRHYDQIAFAPRSSAFDTTGRAGVFDYYNTVFRDNDQDFATYAPLIGPALLKTSKGKPRDAKAQRSYYRTYWRTYQMSDHLPMWVELKVDYGEDYLRRVAGP
jgi:endonuclease/exonuclease/phosphatase family metal-dependent hydrolase